MIDFLTQAAELLDPSRCGEEEFDRHASSTIASLLKLVSGNSCEAEQRLRRLVSIALECYERRACISVRLDGVEHVLVPADCVRELASFLKHELDLPVSTAVSVEVSQLQLWPTRAVAKEIYESIHHMTGKSASWSNTDSEERELFLQIATGVLSALRREFLILEESSGLRASDQRR